jgi:hypothetical protein
MTQLNADGFPVGEWTTEYQDPNAPAGFGGVNDLDSFDVGEVDAKSSGLPIDLEGAYHLQVTKSNWSEAPNRRGRRELLVSLTCLHSTAGQSPEGSVLYHRAELPQEGDKMANDGKQPLWPLLIASICRFAAGCGVFDVVKQSDGTERFIDPATNSTKLQLSTLPSRLMGRQMIGRPKRRDYTKADGTAAHSVELSYGRGVSAIDAPANMNVPINEAVAAANGYRKAWPPAPPPAPAVAKTAAAKSAARAAVAAPNVPPARPVQQALPVQVPGSPVAPVAEADPYGDM